MPVITVMLIIPMYGEFPLKALVDTGAADTLINLSYLEQANIDVRKLKSKPGSGVGGNITVYEFPGAAIKFQGKTTKIDGGFSSGFPQNLLGRSDFFSHFWLGIDHPKRQMDIIPHTDRKTKKKKVNGLLSEAL